MRKFVCEIVSSNFAMFAKKTKKKNGIVVAAKIVVHNYGNCQLIRHEQHENHVNKNLIINDAHALAFSHISFLECEKFNFRH